MEPVTTSLGLLTFGAFLKSVVAKIALSSTEAASKQLIKIIRENLQDGSLPANHDLQLALEHSLAQAANAFACAVGNEFGMFRDAVENGIEMKGWFADNQSGYGIHSP